MELGIIEKALRIAAKAHKEQVRKTDKSPYIVHPIQVGIILMLHQFDDEVVASGIVHDVIEDTDVTEAELREELGDVVVDIVLQISENKDLEWKERKLDYIETVRNGSDAVKAVSIADKIHNMKSLLDSYEVMGSDVLKVFTRGNKEGKLWFEEECLKMFKESWGHPLVDEYESLVEKFRELK